MIKQIIKLWNTNFNKGITIYQIFLMCFLITGAIISNKSLILFTTANILIGYFEPNQDRFGLGARE